LSVGNGCDCSCGGHAVSWRAGWKAGGLPGTDFIALGVPVRLPPKAAGRSQALPLTGEGEGEGAAQAAQGDVESGTGRRLASQAGELGPALEGGACAESGASESGSKSGRFGEGLAATAAGFVLVLQPEPQLLGFTATLSREEAPSRRRRQRQQQQQQQQQQPADDEQQQRRQQERDEEAAQEDVQRSPLPQDDQDSTEARRGPWYAAGQGPPELLGQTGHRTLLPAQQPQVQTQRLDDAPGQELPPPPATTPLQQQEQQQPPHRVPSPHSLVSRRAGSPTLLRVESAAAPAPPGAELRVRPGQAVVPALALVLAPVAAPALAPGPAAGIQP
jgi:hypothetical protein